MDIAIKIEVVIKDYPFGSYNTPGGGAEYAVAMIAEKALGEIYDDIKRGIYVTTDGIAERSSDKILAENASNSIQLSALLYAVVAKEYYKTGAPSVAKNIARAGAKKILDSVGLRGVNYARALFEMYNYSDEFVELIKNY